MVVFPKEPFLGQFFEVNIKDHILHFDIFQFADNVDHEANRLYTIDCPQSQ